MGVLRSNKIKLKIVGPTEAENRKAEFLLGAEFIGDYVQTDDGKLITAISPAWLAIYNKLIEDPQLMFEFSKAPEKFEEFIAATYERSGFTAVLTPRSGDKGRDVIATKEGFGSIRILDQCKAYGRGHLVGLGDVREMQGVLAGDPNASKAVISTTSQFAKGVKESEEFQRAVPYRLELREGNDLIRLLNEYQDIR